MKKRGGQGNVHLEASHAKEKEKEKEKKGGILHRLKRVLGLVKD